MSDNPFALQEATEDLKDRELEDPGFNQDNEFNFQENKEIIINHKKLFFFKIVAISIIGFLLINLFRLQILKGDYFRDLAEGNRIRTKEIRPLRGLIYDRNSIPLVKNQLNFSLYLVPGDLATAEEERSLLKQEVINFLPDKKDEINELFNKKFRYDYEPHLLKKNLEYEEALALMIKSVNLPGIVLEEDYWREYSYSREAAFILGYLGIVSQDDLEKDKYYTMSDSVGKQGIELNYENLLRGQKGKKLIEVNSLGKEFKILKRIEPQKGKNLYLTIDIDLQRRAFEILSKAIEKEEGIQRAGLVILNPQNGEMLALISLPSYNNNDFAQGINSDIYKNLINNPNKPLFNRVISGTYPPGSTFKLIVGAAALEEGIIDLNYTVLSQGGLGVGSWFFPDWRTGGHGLTNFSQAIAWSVNTYFYIIGGGYQDQDGLGLERIVNYAGKFNLGNPTGVDLPGEAPGFLPSEEWKIENKGEKWYLGDTYHLSIGQGDILATPLQVALWTSFFANQGKLYQPHLNKEKTPKIINQQFISPENIQAVRNGMRQAVLTGSAQRLLALPKAVAAKTGTAQFSREREPHGWFTGFGPYNAPEIVVTVLMEESGGASKALPIAEEIFKMYFEKQNE